MGWRTGKKNRGKEMNSCLCLVPMRTGSARLPYKHFYMVKSKRIVELLAEQLFGFFGEKNVVFCIPDDGKNDLLADYFASMGWRFHRGNEKNVLARLQSFTREVKYDWVVRINGDNVLIFRDLIASAVRETEYSDVDLITNVFPRSYPKGCSIEIIKTEIFNRVDSNLLSSEDQEHVFPYFYRNLNKERILNIECASNYSDLDFSCDDFRQLELIRKVLSDEKKAWCSSDLDQLRKISDSFDEENPFLGKSGVFTIAEVGGNHEGDFEYAKELVFQACQTAVDSVKLQVYTPSLLVNRNVDRNRYEHFKKFALKKDQYVELFEMISGCGKRVSASVWSLEELCQFEKYLDFIKIGSGDLTDALMLDAVKKTEKPVVLSTGLSNLEEISWALMRLGVNGKENKVGLLQCTSMYPIPDIDSNLNVIQVFKEKFGVIVGYSDHTIGLKALELSVAAGARIQEFHFTNDREGKTFRDHLVSLTPIEVDELIERNVLSMTLLGSADKVPAISEDVSGHTKSFRKALYPVRDLKKYETVLTTDLVALRPLKGISAKDVDQLVGRRLNCDLEALQPLSFDFFE